MVLPEGHFQEDRTMTRKIDGNRKGWWFLTLEPFRLEFFGRIKKQKMLMLQPRPVKAEYL